MYVTDYFLEDANIITKASYSSWAALIVAVPKKMGNLEFMVTIK